MIWLKKKQTTKTTAIFPCLMLPDMNFAICVFFFFCKGGGQSEETASRVHSERTTENHQERAGHGKGG